VEVLLLDEPTNHLALDVATRLEAAVVRWNGTVVIASHDRWLRRRWNGESLELGEDAVDDTGGSTTPR
jgi:macrolide transport system ATP-binding/permease protein